jgi:hypothetical protein
MSNELRGFAREALVAYEQGFRIIAARLNEVLKKHAPSLQINSDPPESGLTFVGAARRLHNVLMGLRPYYPDLPDDRLLPVWSLGHINSENNPPFYVGIASGWRLVGPDEIESQFRALEERAGWSLDKWRTCTVEPVEQHAEQWRTFLRDIESEARRVTHNRAQALAALLTGDTDTDLPPHADTYPNTALANTGGQRKSASRNATCNERMAGEITKNPEALGWNSRQWAEYLKCAKSTVVATETWKRLEIARLKAKAERMKDRSRKPKGSDQRCD